MEFSFDVGSREISPQIAEGGECGKQDHRPVVLLDGGHADHHSFLSSNGHPPKLFDVVYRAVKDSASI